MRTSVRIVRRGRTVELSGEDALMTLLDWLRLREGATGTKEGCAEGDCGACTVILAQERCGRVVHEAVNSCILLAGQADGAEVVTVEDLAGSDGALHPVQDAMWRQHGSQCGFCTPGIVMSLAALQAEATRPVTRDAVCDQLAGNLCRCTGYRPIIEAALEACQSTPTTVAKAEASTLSALRCGDDLFAGDAARKFFAAPRSESELARLLDAHPDAILFAGGTDAGLWITKKLVRLDQAIWLGRVEGLDRIETLSSPLSPSPQGGRGLVGQAGAERVVAIGAAVTVANAAGVLGAIAPDMTEIIRRFGSAQVRATATVGGNIANGSPIGDLAPCLIALGAQLELASVAGTRVIALEDFFIAYGKQDRRPGEYVRRVLVPLQAENVAFKAFKISKRMDEDISAVLGAFAFTLEGQRVSSAWTGFGGMAGTPSRARATEEALVGADLDQPSSWKPALDALSAEFSPLSDHRASAAYRRLVARNLLEKALTELAGAPLTVTRIKPTGEARHAGE